MSILSIFTNIKNKLEGKKKTDNAQAIPAETGSADIDLAEKSSANTVPTETGKADIVPAETGSADTVLSETGSADIVPAETGSADTVLSETGKADIVLAEKSRADAVQDETGRADAMHVEIKRTDPVQDDASRYSYPADIDMESVKSNKIKVKSLLALEFTTIQSAIDAASPGDTITVPVGVYYEQITINKPLTVLGAGAYRIPVEGGRPGGESAIAGQYPVTIAANGVTFNGFEVRNFWCGITIPQTAFVAPDFLIQNISIAYNWIHAEDNAWIGIVTQPGLLRNLAITNNIVFVNNVSHPYALAAIDFSGAAMATTTPTYENIEVSQNEITNPMGLYGLFCDLSPATYLINQIVIRANWFRNTNGTTFNIGNIVNGQFIDNVADGSKGVLGMQFSSIIGNTFKNGASLEIWGTESGLIRPSMHTAIYNNEFTDEVSGNGLRIRIGVLSYTMPVHYNAFRNSGISPSAPPDYSTGYLIRNEGLGTLDVTYNWWGSADGPSGNAGDIVGATVTSPWIRMYTDDPAKQTPPTGWPLSTIMTAQPGFWSIYPTGISYIGKTCFNEGEGIVLLAQVSYSGGDGSGYVVGFDINGLSYISQTLTGGVAYVYLRELLIGVYTLTARSGPYSSGPVQIRVGGCGPDSKLDSQPD